MFVGVDLGKDKHVCYAGGKFFVITDNLKGYTEFLDKICTEEAEEVVVCLENKNSRFAKFLVSCGFEVRIMDGAQSNHLRKVLNPSGKKDDLEDAKVLAKGVEMLRESLELLKIDKELERLKSIMNQYKKADTRLQKLLNMLHADVKEEAPEFYDHVTMKNKSTLSYIATGEVCNELPPEARNMEVNFSPVVQLTAASALALSREKDRLTKELERELEKFEEHKILKSIKGLGPISSAVLIITLREKNFKDYRGLQAYMGTSPVTKSSGKKTYQIKRQAYNKYMGSKLLMMAQSTMIYNKWCRDYYYRKKEEGKSHGHALRALANTWLKIIFAMLKHKELYHENECGLPCRKNPIAC